MRKLLFFVLAALAFASCTQDVVVEVTANKSDSVDTITVGFEGNENETRIQLNDQKQTVWTKDDLVSVFYRSNANQKWKYEGETGARTAELKRVNAGSATREMDRVVIVYPYNEDYYINPSTYNVQASLPAVQTYVDNSYGLNGNIMVSSSEYNQFSLKSVCGWLKLQLKGDGEVVKSITLRGNNGEQVAGELYINTSDATAVLASEMGSSEENNAGGSLVFEDTILSEVTLDCGEGVKLLPVATSFYIALPPCTFEKGFTVEITDDSDYTMVQSTSKEMIIERNHIQPMAAFTFVNPNVEGEPKPANNEIWYTATEKVEPYWDDANTYGVRLVTNTWDEATGKGIYTFAGDVTKVGAEAFLECKKLQSIVLPDSATEIGSNAFKNCDDLKEVTIGDGVKKIGSSAFYDCDALTTVSLGDSLETISYQAFYSCNNLKEIVIGGNVTTIGESVFYQCNKLESVVIGDSVTSVGNRAFYECYALNNVVIGSGLTQIGSQVFYRCTGLQSIVIPDNVVAIKSNAFYGCSKLENITIGNSVEEIDAKAFDYCNAIKTFYGKYTTTDGRALVKDDKLILYAKASGTEYTIPDGVTTIGSYAFSYSTLTSVTIPESVTAIEDYAFSNCSNLKKVYIYALMPPSLGGNAFSNNATGRRFYVYDEVVDTYKHEWGYSSSILGNGSYDGSEQTTIYYTTNDGNIVDVRYLPVKENTYIDGQGKIVVFGKLDKIPSEAFWNRVNLVSVTIPEGVKVIGDGAFSSSWNLESVAIPDGVTYIGSEAFRGSKLTSITIPNSVMDIGMGAFCDCQYLTNFSGKFATDNGDAIVVNDKFIAFAPKSSKSSYTIPESVTIIGDFAFCGSENLTSISIPDSVTSIGNYAFQTCYNLSDITVGCGVQDIGYYAFSYCSNQLTIYMKPITPPTLDLDNVFDGWYNDNEDGFLKIFVPVASEYAYKSSWTTWASYIRPYDFDRVQTNYEIWYTSIDEVLISPYVYYNDANVVSNTYKNGIGVISFDREVTSVSESMFIGQNNLLSITLPETVTSIGDNAFSSCYSLRSITIPDSVEEIGECVFEGCSNIVGFKGKYAKDNGKILVINGVLKALAYLEVEQYTIPDYVTEIGSYAFYSRYNLRSVTIPNSVTKIGKGAFYQCSNITSITIPDSVTEIESWTFYYCSGLKSITIPNSVTEIGEWAFSDCKGLTSITIPDSVSSIGEHAFYQCTGLTSVTIGNGVTSIETWAFNRCYNLSEFKGKFAEDNGRVLVVDGCVVAFAPAGLTEYTIPSNVISIGGYTFYGSDNLTSITIPSSVTSIGRQAFDYSDNLASIYCQATTPPTCDMSQFSGIASGFKIYVPAESVSAYKAAAYWKNKADAIVGYDF